MLRSIPAALLLFSCKSLGLEDKKSEGSQSRVHSNISAAIGSGQSKSIFSPLYFPCLGPSVCEEQSRGIQGHLDLSLLADVQVDALEGDQLPQGLDDRGYPGEQVYLGNIAPRKRPRVLDSQAERDGVVCSERRCQISSRGRGAEAKAGKRGVRKPIPKRVRGIGVYVDVVDDVGRLLVIVYCGERADG